METIHISLGPTANSITSHLFNLYGGSVTPSSSSDGSNKEESLCDPNVTHELLNSNAADYDTEYYYNNHRSRGKHYYLLPRALFIDNRDNYSPIVAKDDVVISWSYGVETRQSRPQTEDVCGEFRMGQLTLAQSRFACNNRDDCYSGNANSNHYNDSEEEEEEEDIYNTETPEEKRRRLEVIESRHAKMKKDIKDNLENFWENTFYNEDSSDGRGIEERHDDPTADTANPPNQDKRPKNNEREIHWHQYLTMPTQSSKYQVPLPFDSTTDMTSLHMGRIYSDTAWRDNMSESIRKILERCDQIKGFNLIVDGGVHNSNQLCQYNAGGMYAGLAITILEELQDECKSAGRMTALVDSLLDNGISTKELDNCDEKEKESMAVQHFQRRLNSGLALHGLSTNSDVFLPLSIESAHKALFGKREVSFNRRMFEGSAALALALEASTLPYRLRTSQISTPGCQRRSRLGIQSGFYQGSVSNDNNEPFASVNSLTYHEFLTCLRSSSDKRRSILELDALMSPLSFPATGTGFGMGADLSSNILAQLMANGVIGGGQGVDNQDLGLLHQKLVKGTVVQQMMMEQNRNYRSRNYSSGRQTGPGEWLENHCEGGLLGSLSGHSNCGRRSNHHHFALSSALRPASCDVKKFPSHDCGTSAFLRPIMESMGVKYRSEVSSGVVVKDTVADVTEVGSYWNTIFKRIKYPTNDEQSAPLPEAIADHTPILSVMGNSTRSYRRLHSISSGFVDSLHSRRNMGYLARDVMSGKAPEKDDCEEALEHCRELVDVYEPPLGSGLVVGENENDLDDAYFDE